MMQAAPHPELHLVSLVLHAVPRRLDAVREAALAHAAKHTPAQAVA